MDKTVPASSTRMATARVISPLRLFVLLLVVLYFAEAIIMFTLPLLFPDPSTPLANFADSLLLVTLSAPFIWILIVQPLRNAVKTEATWAAALLENVADGVIVFNNLGIVMSLNPAAEQIFGYFDREMVGQHLNSLLIGQQGRDENYFILQWTSDSRNKENRLSHDILGQRNNGTSFPMDFSLTKVHLAGETAFIGIVRDTTERKQIEAAMIEKQSQLAELNISLEKRVEETVNELREKDRILIQQSRLAAMGDMINNIAHQWRQPLNILGLLIQQMQMFYHKGSFTREYMDESVDKSMSLINYLSKTIDDFRSFFKAEKEMVEFAIHEVVARTVSLVEDGFSSQEIKVSFHSNANPVVRGFPNEYSQALLNILLNARDALLQRQTEDAKVTVTIDMEGEKSVVTIADNAGGIAEEIMGNIFEPYFTTKGPERGTGLGLFMSKTIIEKNMNGKLTARNTSEGAELRIEV